MNQPIIFHIGEISIPTTSKCSKNHHKKFLEISTHNLHFAIPSIAQIISGLRRQLGVEFEWFPFISPESGEHANRRNLKVYGRIVLICFRIRSTRAPFIITEYVHRFVKSQAYFPKPAKYPRTRYFHNRAFQAINFSTGGKSVIKNAKYILYI